MLFINRSTEEFARKITFFEAGLKHDEKDNSIIFQGE